MKALVIVAHGSRRESSNDEVRELTRQVAANAGDDYAIVTSAFLELATPSIPDGIQQCIDAGASEVIVQPYFLSAGRHVVEDIPADIQLAKDRNPQIKIQQTPYLGAAPAVADLLLELAKQ